MDTSMGTRLYPLPGGDGDGIKLLIRSYPGKSMIVSEFEPSRGTTQINQRRTQNKTKMEDAQSSKLISQMKIRHKDVNL